MERGFLADLDPEARSALDSLGRTVRFPAGAVLFLEGDVGTKVVVIRSGHVKVVATSEDGHAVVLALRGPGDVLGDLSAIDGAARSATGIALDSVEARVVAAEDFRRLLEQTPGAAFALLREVVARMREADRRRVEFGARDTLGRVALRLLDLADAEEEEEGGIVRISVPLTQEDLAGWVAASRESVARALASLRGRRLISTARREIVILDYDGLRDAAR